jgi:hypothetical protein
VHDDASLEPSPEQLFGEEGVALALGSQQSTQRRINRSAKSIGRKGPQVSLGERTKRDGGKLPETIEFSQCSFKGEAMRDLAFAVGAQDKQTCVRLGACDITEQVERGDVGPL